MKKKRKVLLIGLDGGRGDLVMQFFRKHAQHLSKINSFQLECYKCGGGCAYPQSGPRTGKGYLWKTCPGWSSVLSGVDNSKHNVRDNTSESIQAFWKCGYPAFLQIAYEHNYRVAAVGRPNVLAAKKETGILDQTQLHYRQSIPVAAGKSGDVQNTKYASELISKNKVDVIFVHLDGLDQAGHLHKWGSKEYRKAFFDIDRYVGKLLEAIKQDEAKNPEVEWLTIVTADHGGHSFGHDLHSKLDNCIPFLLSRKPSRRYLDSKQRTRQFDAAPTALKWLHIRIPRYMDGHSLI